MTRETASLNQQTVSATLSFAAPIARRLENAETEEVLEFLKQRPLHTFVMSGFIRDNGIVSDCHRGIFYGCRDAGGALEGVALIGHAIYIEARSERALREFARVASECLTTHLILGEQKMIGPFWKHYAVMGQTARRVGHELLLEKTSAEPTVPALEYLRPANLDELEVIVSVHAALALEESGVNPLDRDATGFRSRCRRRIEQGRVWVLVTGGELIFKVDVISDTREVIYLEGVYVNPKYRGQGYGSRCLSQLSRQLLQRTSALTALVNEDKTDALRFFDKVGFARRAVYDTIFL